MGRPKKGNSETLLSETNESLQPLMVNFKGEKTVYEFKNAIVCGVIENNNSDNEISTIINGFNKYDDFVMVFNNVVLQAYDYLQQNAENTKMEIIDAMRFTINTIFEGIEDGEYDEYFQSAVTLEDTKA